MNLFWAIDRMKGLFAELLAAGASLDQIKERLLAEAHAMYEEDIAACKAMGAYGGALLPDEGGVLTHCNAGALATCGYGTALGVIRAAVEQGKQIHVYADETRPFLQGARLTAWELMADGIPTTVICDNMAASLMRQGRFRRWWSAPTASRPTATSPTRSAPTTWPFWPGSTASRFTWLRRGRPSTLATATATPSRSKSGRREVTHHGGKQMTPHGVGICNPAFDVTPAKYVTAIITERGVLRAPYLESLREMELVAR